MNFGIRFFIRGQWAFLLLLLFAADNATAQLITVKPGQLNYFAISAPGDAVSGEDFFLQIKAHDNKGNVITNYSDVGKSVKLISTGTQQLTPKSVSAASFIGGVATVKAVYYKAEDISITVKDFSGSRSGKSGLIKIKPNTIHHFSIVAPTSVVAGSPIKLRITSLDAYENVIGAYNSMGKGANVSTSGTSKVSPNFIPSSSFTGGVADLTFTYNKAENITINLSEKDRPDISKSNRIAINPASLDRFVVTTGGVAIAGEPFAIKIKAVDAYDNVISNYNTTGKNVILASSGAGELTPNVVTASSFVDGLANVKVRYDKAESFSVNVYQEGMQGAPKRNIAAPVQTPIKENKRIDVVVSPTVEQPSVRDVQPVPSKQEERAPVAAEDDFSDMLILD